jgi:hypothetical protein
MKIHQLLERPTPAMAGALAEFEKPFTYPLGPGKYFRISHGEDYTLFFRAQGIGACFVAEQEDRIIGALGTAIRRLWMPDGTERLAAYFGDLKIATEARGGSVLLRMARAAEAWLRPKVDMGFGVVMGGTSLLPEAYTGRAGIPDFRAVGRLAILRFSGNPTPKSDPNLFLTNREAGLAAYQRLSSGRHACPVGETEKRSEITPVWLVSSDGRAVGMLEDTRKAKRLITGEGPEMLSAHLTCFAYSSAVTAAELIRVALQHAISLGLPALFLSVTEQDSSELRDSLSGVDVLPAPAIVYGTGLAKGDWNINTAEI